MKVRPAVWYAVGAIAIAVAFFLLGSYVFPQGGVQRTADEHSDPAALSPARTEAAVEASSLEEFGIEAPGAGATVPGTPDGAVGAAGTGTSAETVGGPTLLRASDLLRLEEPVPVRLVGTIMAVDEMAGTAEVRVEQFSVLVTDESEDGRRSLPAGSKVTVVLPPLSDGESRAATLTSGRMVRAEIRVEPASGDRTGRIVAVRFEVLGSQQ